MASSDGMRPNPATRRNDSSNSAFRHQYFRGNEAVIGDALVVNVHVAPPNQREKSQTLKVPGNAHQIVSNSGKVIGFPMQCRIAGKSQNIIGCCECDKTWWLHFLSSSLVVAN